MLSIAKIVYCRCSVINASEELVIRLDDGDKNLLRNFSNYVPIFMLEYSPRVQYYLSVLWEPESLYIVGFYSNTLSNLCRSSCSFLASASFPV
jgi:hypothetical protein